MKLAAYLDEVSDDVATACSILNELSINAVCLRNAWTHRIDKLNDDALQIIKDNLSKYNIKVVLLCSSITQNTTDSDLTRAINVCKFFNCNYIKLHLDQVSKSDKAFKNLELWMSSISDRTIKDDIRPVFELTHSFPIDSPSAVSLLLSKSKRWGVVFDPAVLIMKCKMNPYTTYWSLFNKNITHIDIHDYKIGHSAQPAGCGDAKLDIILSDSINNKYQGWYCLEPGLTRRYMNITSFGDIFKLNFGHFKKLVDRVSL